MNNWGRTKGQIVVRADRATYHQFFFDGSGLFDIFIDYVYPSFGVYFSVFACNSTCWWYILSFLLMVLWYRKKGDLNESLCSHTVPALCRWRILFSPLCFTRVLVTSTVVLLSVRNAFLDIAKCFWAAVFEFAWLHHPTIQRFQVFVCWWKESVLSHWKHWKRT